MNDSQSMWAAAAACAVTFALYAFTAFSGPGWHDSAELSLRALQLGATHAPGAPLHTLIGHVLIALGGSPASALTWLSVCCVAVAAGVVARLLTEFVDSGLTAFVGALMFAVLFPVWGIAVITELYALSLLLVALALHLAWLWQRDNGRDMPLAINAVLALSLGAHFANVLVLPAFALFVALRSRSLRTTVIFCAALALSILVVAFANVLLASNVPPFGRYVPDTLNGLYLYMTGADYQVPQAHEPGFWLRRIAEHSAIFSGNFLYIGIAPMLMGVIVLFRHAIAYAWLAVLIWGSYLAYFTLFGSGDYFVMVAPAYLISAVWLVVGLAELGRQLRPQWRVAIAVAPLMLMLSVALFQQLNMRRSIAVDTSVSDYLQDAFATFPDEALVVARWNEFTALRYAQVVDGQRPDVLLLLPARSERHYSHGTVQDYMALIDSTLCERPVVTNRIDADVTARYRTEHLDVAGAWARLLPLDVAHCANETNVGR